jgi:hypothetical protein
VENPPAGGAEKVKNQLPDNLRQALLAYDSPMALITEVNHETAIVAKMPSADLAGFRGASVAYHYELAQYDEGPVLRLAMNILDDPNQPFGIETFLDVNKPEDLALAEKLADQATLTLHFYDFGLTYQFSKQLRHRKQQRQELARLIRLALDHLETVTEPDWYAARQRFMREVQR